MKIFSIEFFNGKIKLLKDEYPFWVLMLVIILLFLLMFFGIFLVIEALFEAGQVRVVDMTFGHLCLLVVLTYYFFGRSSQ